jgi:hypothetical protein
MPTLGTSLVGFMEQQEAVNYLKNQCVPLLGADDASLIGDWQTAREKLGVPIANAGYPDIQQIPSSQAAYMADLVLQPWVANALIEFPGSEFRLVEIEPLLAFQFAIDSIRSQHHCAPFSKPPSLEELLMACLPNSPTSDPVRVVQGEQSMLITSRSLNLRSLAQGFMNGAFLGMHVGLALPLVHVVRLNGRCYLHNGFHRALGARLAGATHVPCLIRDVNDAAAAAIKPPGTFGLPLLESSDPPTMGHYAQGRAHDVSLRIYTRALHVSWAEYAVPEE